MVSPCLRSVVCLRAAGPVCSHVLAGAVPRGLHPQRANAQRCHRHELQAAAGDSGSPQPLHLLPAGGRDFRWKRKDLTSVRRCLVVFVCLTGGQLLVLGVMET